MVEKARKVCKDFSNIEFHTQSLKEFTSDEKYDAIVAASSMHWALADNDRDGLIEKMSTLLKDGGSLVLFWNFPAELNEDVSAKLAEALKDLKPYFPGSRRFEDIWSQMRARTVDPIEASPFFAKFTTAESPFLEGVPIESYINLLKTTSTYISMEDKDRESYFAIMRKVLRQECGDVVPVHRMSMFNISHKRK
jgi:SAM-dependent methyltransferase